MGRRERGDEEEGIEGEREREGIDGVGKREEIKKGGLCIVRKERRKKWELHLLCKYFIFYCE